MWFVSKKKYNALLKQKEDFDRIATNAVDLNARLLDDQRQCLDELKRVQELNHQLTKYNDVLVARVKDLETKLALVIKQQTITVPFLDGVSDAYEEGKAISREAE